MNKRRKSQIFFATALIALGWAWYQHLLSFQRSQNNPLQMSSMRALHSNRMAPSNSLASKNSPQTTNNRSNESTEPTVTYAQKLIDQGHFKEGSQILESIIATDPNNTQALMELAMVYTLDFKEPSKSRAILERIIDVNPNHRAALNELELIYKELGAVDDGLALLQLKTQQYPDSLELQFAYARMLSNSNPEAAIPWLQKATKIPDLKEQVLTQLATTAMSAGKYELAVQSLREALNLSEQELDHARAHGEPGVDFLEERINSTKSELAKAQTHLNSSIQ